MIRSALILAAVAALVAAFWWWGGVRYAQGYQAREIEVQEARDAQEVALHQLAQASRQAAEDIRAAERDLARRLQEALDALPEDARRLCVDPDALGLLRSVQ